MSDLFVLIPYDHREVLSKKYMLSWNPSTKLWSCGNERIYNMAGMNRFHIKRLDVHFVNKDAAKKLGCKWLPIYNKWCIAMEVYNNNPAMYDALAVKPSNQPTFNYDEVVDEDIL